MIKIIYSFVFIMAISVAVSGTTTGNSALAAPISAFNPGRIADDEVFYNKNAIGSVQAVQDFLTAHTPTCDTWGTQPSGYGNLNRAQYAQQVMGWPGPPYSCLQNYHENPTTGETSFEKGGGSFAGGQSSAQIIWDASQQYGINPQVLLVMLRKESLNLYGDSWPLKNQYRYAMGYACPDSGPNYSANCATDKGGFYNQMRLAAWQLRYYYDHMGSYNFAPGRWNTIQYDTDPACGTKQVFIENYATASLYIYTPYTPSDAAFEAYPGEVPCGAYGNRNFWYMFNEWFGPTVITGERIASRPHVSGTGWMSEVRDSAVVGTTGKAKSLEAVTMRGEVEYSTYNKTQGWQPTVNRGMVSGTTSLGEPLQAIKIKLTGNLAKNYDVYYRAHVSNIGWMSWTKNGLPAGVSGGSALNLEAYEIRLVMKGLKAPTVGTDSFRNISTTAYNPIVDIKTSAHVSNYGWQPTIQDKMVAGTMKQKLPIEAVRISVANKSAHQGGVAYSTHIEGIGWQKYAFDGGVSGTTGQSRRTEAIRIGLTGDLQNHYDVWYRTHVQGFGWLGWAKNNQPAGSVGAALRLEAIEVRILPKGSGSLSGSSYLYNPVNQKLPISYSFQYSAHVSDKGWLPPVGNGVMAGTTGKSLPMEALKINTVASALGNIDLRCSGYTATVGWVSENVTKGSICGTTGQSRPIQALKFSLTEQAATKYSLAYRVHVSKVGWTQWLSADSVAGTPGTSHIEAVELLLSELY